MATLTAALLIFCLRICDVSIGTMRVIYMVRGRRMIAGLLGLLESGLFIFAISRVLQDVSYPKMLGYACGYATGTIVGISIEGWIASGQIMVRIISRSASAAIRDALLAADFGVTTLAGHGRDGERLVLFVVAMRRRGRELLEIVRRVDPEAFITFENVTQAIGGHLPLIGSQAQVRK